MANTRRILKPYKGFNITIINKYMYTAYNGSNSLKAYSLKEIKRLIDLLKPTYE